MVSRRSQRKGRAGPGTAGLKQWGKVSGFPGERIKARERLKDYKLIFRSSDKFNPKPTIKQLSSYLRTVP